MSALWHDLECGSYEVDLLLWEELADAGKGPILDLGCGSGRVGLHLARRGRSVRGLDIDADLVAAFNDRADAAALPGSATVGDAREFDLGEEFGVVVAPMQLIQLLDGSSERVACMRSARRHLQPGGRLAVAIVEDVPTSPAGRGPLPLPDAREQDGWVYSSLPLDAFVEARAIVVRRLRQTVSPAGELTEAVDEVRLSVLSARTLETEAEEAGLRSAGRREVAATDAHVGSTVVLLEAP